MEERDVLTGFPVTIVKEKYRNEKSLLFLFRLIYIALGIWAFWYYQHETLWSDKIWYVLLYVFCLWRMYTIGEYKVFLCDTGMIVQRRPLNSSEYIASLWNPKSLFIFLEYDKIQGFSDRWDELHVGQQVEGGMYIISLDLQYLDNKDKSRVIAFIREQQKINN